MPNYHDFTEINLITLLKNGDTLAFQEIYNRNWQKLFTSASRSLQSSEIAEEIIHDVLLKLWKTRASLTIEKTLEGYLLTAVKHQVINHLRHRFRRRVLMDQHLVDLPADHQQESVMDYITEKEIAQELEEGILLMPEKCRIVYRMSREQGYSFKQISQELSISTSTVDSHINKALRILRKHFSKYLYLFPALFAVI